MHGAAYCWKTGTVEPSGMFAKWTISVCQNSSYEQKAQTAGDVH